MTLHDYLGFSMPRGAPAPSSATGPPAAARRRHARSAQQPSVPPARTGANSQQLGERGAWAGALPGTACSVPGKRGDPREGRVSSFLEAFPARDFCSSLRFWVSIRMEGFFLGMEHCHPPEKFYMYPRTWCIFGRTYAQQYVQHYSRRYLVQQSQWCNMLAVRATVSPYLSTGVQQGPGPCLPAARGMFWVLIKPYPTILPRFFFFFQVIIGRITWFRRWYTPIFGSLLYGVAFFPGTPLG